MKQVPECMCSMDTSGDCREREIATRTVHLPDQLVVECDWGGGFEGMLEAAAHTWFYWAFPDHDSDLCWEVNCNAAVLTRGDHWRLLVFDLDDQLWEFQIGPFDFEDFPCDPDL